MFFWLAQGCKHRRSAWTKQEGRQLKDGCDRLCWHIVAGRTFKFVDFPDAFFLCFLRGGSFYFEQVTNSKRTPSETSHMGATSCVSESAVLAIGVLYAGSWL